MGGRLGTAGVVGFVGFLSFSVLLPYFLYLTSLAIFHVGEDGGELVVIQFSKYCWLCFVAFTHCFLFFPLPYQSLN